MEKTHIPEVMRTGCFRRWRLWRVVEPLETGRTAYTIDYLCQDKQHYALYQREHAPELQRAHTERYAGRFTARRSLLEACEND